MGKDTKTVARRAGLLAVAVALGLALSAAARRRAGTRSETGDAYRCTCGAQYRVRGVDRHRIYFRGDEPVLGDRCAECDAPLPVGHDGAVV